MFYYREQAHPRPGEGDRFQEVAGEQGLGLGAQKVRPGAGGPVGSRVDPGLFKVSQALADAFVCR
jgi:hypothetical protein